MVSEHNVTLLDLVNNGYLLAGTQVRYNYRGVQYVGIIDKNGEITTSDGHSYINPTHWTRTVSGNNCSGWGTVKVSSTNIPLLTLKQKYLVNVNGTLKKKKEDNNNNSSSSSSNSSNNNNNNEDEEEDQINNNNSSSDVEKSLNQQISPSKKISTKLKNKSEKKSKLKNSQTKTTVTTTNNNNSNNNNNTSSSNINNSSSSSISNINNNTSNINNISSGNSSSNNNNNNNNNNNSLNSSPIKSFDTNNNRSTTTPSPTSSSASFDSPSFNSTPPLISHPYPPHSSNNHHPAYSSYYYFHHHPNNSFLSHLQQLPNSPNTPFYYIPNPGSVTTNNNNNNNNSSSNNNNFNKEASMPGYHPHLNNATPIGSSTSDINPPIPLVPFHSSQQFHNQHTHIYNNDYHPQSSQHHSFDHPQPTTNSSSSTPKSQSFDRPTSSHQPQHQPPPLFSPISGASLDIYQQYTGIETPLTPFPTIPISPYHHPSPIFNLPTPQIEIPDHDKESNNNNNNSNSTTNLDYSNNQYSVNIPKVNLQSYGHQPINYQSHMPLQQHQSNLINSPRDYRGNSNNPNNNNSTSNNNNNNSNIINTIPTDRKRKINKLNDTKSNNNNNNNPNNNIKVIDTDNNERDSESIQNRKKIKRPITPTPTTNKKLINNQQITHHNNNYYNDESNSNIYYPPHQQHHQYQQSIPEYNQQPPQQQGYQQQQVHYSDDDVQLIYHQQQQQQQHFHQPIAYHTNQQHPTPYPQIHQQPQIIYNNINNYNEETNYHNNHYGNSTAVRICYLNNTAYFESCKSCGGFDEERILYCIDCGEGYHTYCLNIDIPESNLDFIESWRCLSCKVCEVCMERLESGPLNKGSLKSILNFSNLDPDQSTGSRDSIYSCKNCNSFYHHDCLIKDKKIELKQEPPAQPTTTINFKQCKCYESIEKLKIQDQIEKQQISSDDVVILEDERICALCKKKGDSNLEGRLIPLLLDCWVHLNCIYFSQGLVIKSPNQIYPNNNNILIITNVHKLIEKFKKQKCFKCKKLGASITCQTCNIFGHLTCCVNDKWYIDSTHSSNLQLPTSTSSTSSSGGSFHQVYCKSHIPLELAKKEQTKTLNSPKQLYINSNIIDLNNIKNTEGGVPLFSLDKNDQNIVFHYKFKIGSLRIESIGEVQHLNPNFHCKDAIFPLNYFSIRKYWSIFSLDERIDYICKVETSGDLPLFRIQVISAINHDEFLLDLKNESIDMLGKDFIDRIIKLHSQVDQSSNPTIESLKKRFDILLFFGLTIPYVQTAIEHMPLSYYCENYKRKYYNLPPYRSARTISFTQYREEIQRSKQTIANNIKSTTKSTKKKRSYSQSTLLEFEKSKINCQKKYQTLLDLQLPNIYVKKSSIHSYGGFARNPIKNGDFVIEYLGETIRQKIADIREKHYQDGGIDCFMFKVDDDIIIDATKKGNRARFINHSCDPNAKTAIITINNEKRIVIIAIKDIKKDEEILYNYCFPKEEDQSQRVQCHCGTQKCTGYLN